MGCRPSGRYFCVCGMFILRVLSTRGLDIPPALSYATEETHRVARCDGGRRWGMRLWTRLREGSTGAEFISAVTLILLGLVRVTGAQGRTSSLLLFFFSLKFPGLWLSLAFILGVLHLVSLCVWSRGGWLVIRKLCAALGFGVYASLVYDLWVRGQIGGVILLGVWVGLLVVAIVRRNYTVVPV